MAILALDQGTSSSRALVIDRSWRVIGRAQAPLPIETPQPGWVECDPEMIWASQITCARAAIQSSGLAPAQIEAIGITNQRETTLLWDRATGAPVGPAIVWQDRRTAPECQALKDNGEEAWLTEKTGLVADPYFSATKLAWMLKGRSPDGLAAGTVDSWLIWRLTGGKVHATDVTNASRTLLMNLEEGQWDESLLQRFAVPSGLLPEIQPSSAEFGTTAPELLGAPIPIRSAVGDQQGALFGQFCHEEGDAKSTYGTGCFLLMSTGSVRPRSSQGLLATAAASITSAPQYALEGSVFIAGAAIQWLRDGLGMIGSSSEVEALAARVPDSGDVWLVPAFAGLGAPYWDPDARGLLIGLTRGTTSSHIARAALESIAHQCADVVEAMVEDAGRPLRSLRADGGAAQNRLLMQLQADLLGIPVTRPPEAEATALGAALLAAHQSGWPIQDARGALGVPEVFHPSAPDPSARSRWKEAVSRSRGWAR